MSTTGTTVDLRGIERGAGHLGPITLVTLLAVQSAVLEAKGDRKVPQVAVRVSEETRDRLIADLAELIGWVPFDPTALKWNAVSVYVEDEPAKDCVGGGFPSRT